MANQIFSCDPEKLLKFRIAREEKTQDVLEWEARKSVEFAKKNKEQAATDWVNFILELHREKADYFFERNLKEAEDTKFLFDKFWGKEKPF